MEIVAVLAEEAAEDESRAGCDLLHPESRISDISAEQKKILPRINADERGSKKGAMLAIEAIDFYGLPISKVVIRVNPRSSAVGFSIARRHRHMFHVGNHGVGKLTSAGGTAHVAGEVKFFFIRLFQCRVDFVRGFYFAHVPQHQHG